MTTEPNTYGRHGMRETNPRKATNRLAEEPFECRRCGYSKFARASEFKHGDPNDQTRVCDDCGMRETTCQGFALCGNPATDLAPHTNLGQVPVCERCKALALRLRYGNQEES